MNFTIEFDGGLFVNYFVLSENGGFFLLHCNEMGFIIHETGIDYAFHICWRYKPKHKFIGNTNFW